MGLLIRPLSLAFSRMRNGLACEICRKQGGTRQLGCWPSAQLYFPSTSSSENLAFHGDKMGSKDHCRIIHCTTARIKARNPAERLSFTGRLSICLLIIELLYEKGVGYYLTVILSNRVKAAIRNQSKTGVPLLCRWLDNWLSEKRIILQVWSLNCSLH